MKPLRLAWKHRVPIGGLESLNHVDVIAWRGHGVVSYTTNSREVGAIFDRDGHLIRKIAAPSDLLDRNVMGLVTTWPDEGIAMGFMHERFEVLWVDLDEPPRSAAFDAPALTTQKLLAMPDGGLLVSTVAGLGDGGRIESPVDLDKGLLQRPFEDRIYVTDCIDPDRSRWRVPGRAACVAEDIVVLEEGAGIAKAIVARSAAEGSEVWRQPALDRFVLGAVPAPAWSEDRIYLYDRGDRRRASWERGAMHAATARVTCASSRTGAPHWTAEIEGDVVSFFAHPAWVAWIVARNDVPALHAHRHDGTRICRIELVPVQPETKWPPGASWPCVVHGDDTHVVVVQRESVEGDRSQLTAIRIADGKVLWGSSLASYLPTRPALRTQRLLNEVPIAFADGVAYFRAGPQLLAFRG